MEIAICEKILLVLAVFTLLSVDVSAVRIVARRNLKDLEIRKELKRLNKPAIKTIKSEDGDIIDCVDIYKQPAFDNPLLKNHTIQMKPSFYDDKKTSALESLEMSWHKSGSCPEGTTPIVRIRKSALLRSMSLNGSKVSVPSQMQHAKYFMEVPNNGGAARINVWNVHVEPFEQSTASIFVRKKDTLDLITAGWMINHYVFGDYRTRIYAFWSSDLGDGGCFNFQCPGFIQTSKTIGLRSTISPLSVYGGDQRDINVKIYMDPSTGNWWLTILNVAIGYWPHSLFQHMVGSADLIEWSGEVLNTEPDNQHTTTQMGSGHFPKEGAGKAAFFDKVVYFQKSDQGIIPDPEQFYSMTSVASCYDVGEAQRNSDGLAFFFGGPGGTTCDVPK